MGVERELDKPLEERTTLTPALFADSVRQVVLWM